jgi:EmrB/QacA subfamily drug resistance transporter
MSDTAVDQSRPGGTPAPDPKRWAALGVIAIAQLMVVLDASIVNIALPSLQADLGITDANRQWVVTAYTLAFGGFLLLGGRIADYAGRKKAFMIGLLGFALASALGGIAANQELLFAARALQGLFAALLAPAALSLVSVTFTEPRERAKAFAVYGALSGGGAAIGLVLGGVLTEYASWRWCLGVNVPIALLAFFLAFRSVRESKATGDTRYDVPGAVTATGGLVALVYAITLAEKGWTQTSTLTWFAIAAVLLVAFFVIETRTSHPLLPLRILTERNRAGAFLASFIVGAGLFAMFLFLSFYFQGVLQYSPIKSGLLFLPFSAGVMVSAGLSSKLLPQIGPRKLAGIGLVIATIGMVVLTTIKAEDNYLINVLPAMLLMSVGMGFTFISISQTALYGVSNHDTGVASAVLNTSQQIGGSIGTALLNTLYTTAVANYLIDRQLDFPTPDALVHGFVQTFWVGAGLIAIGAVVWVRFVRVTKDEMNTVSASAAHIG